MAEIVQVPYNNIYGCTLSFNSATSLNVSAGQTRDSLNNFDIIISSPVVISAGSVGLNGLDTGALANNKLYNVFLIDSSAGFKTAGAILSLSNTPLLPAGYDIIKLIGVCFTNGSAQLVPIYTSGIGSQRTFFYDTPLAVLTDGAATTFTAVPLTNFVPSINQTVVLFNSKLTPQAANNVFALRPTGSTSNGTVLQNGMIATVEQDSQFQMPILLAAGIPSIDYKVANSGDKLTLLVAGFSMSL